MVSGGPAVSGGLRPLRIGEILDTSIKIYTKRAAILFRIVLIVAVPLEILATLLQLSLPAPESTSSQVNVFGSNGFTNPAFNQQPTQGVSGSQIGAIVGGSLVIIILSVLLTLLATATCYKAIIDSYLGREPDWRDSFVFALKRFGTLLGTTFTVLIVTAIGFLFCLAPGIWLYISWLFCTVVVLTEGTGVSGALSRSFDLVRGRWWRTFATYIVGYLFTAIVSGLIGLVLGFLLFKVASTYTATVILERGVNLVAQVITIPFIAAFVTVMYFDVRVRREGFDLQLLASQVGVEPGPGGSPYLPSSAPPGSPSPLGEGLSPGGTGTRAGTDPPYWPPPPGWRPPEQSLSSETPSGPSAPPGPVGETPSRDDRDDGDNPPYWPPPPGWKPRGGGEPPS
jgi:hypothetical protein